MKRLLLLCSSVILFAAAFSCAPTECAPSTPEPYAEGKPYTRWWWVADQIEKEDVRYQLEGLKEQGFGGVEIAWVYPMEGNPDTPRYAWLGQEWAEVVSYA